MHRLRFWNLTERLTNQLPSYAAGFRLSARDFADHVKAAFRGRMFLWLPVLFGTGLLGYFNWPQEPEMLVPVLVLLAAVAGWVRQPHGALRIFSLCIMTMAGGFLWGQYQTTSRDTPLLRYGMTSKLEGRIIWQEKRLNSSLYLIEVEWLEELRRSKRPDKLRLYGQHDYLALTRPGCRVRLTAHLQTLDRALWPHGYEPRFTGHFNGEGGRGFIREMHRIECADTRRDGNSLTNRLKNIRLSLAQRFTSDMEKSAGGIAAALITGIRGQIRAADRDALRQTGLAHMLAISGMHMAMFAGTVYAFLRLLAAAFPVAVQRYNLRRYCAGAAMMSGFGYLLISGAAVATQRAFIMMSLVFMAVMLGRAALTMRNTALAALLVLILAPQNIMLAGFQMSFAAVVSLVAFYETFGRGRLLPRPERRLGFYEKTRRNIVLYFVALLLTSLVAGLTTGYIGVVHFNLIGTYGLLANILAVPLLGLVIMPAGLLALILMPLNIEQGALNVMGWGIDQVLRAAEWVLSFDGAVVYIAASPPFVLPGFALGLVWLCLIQNTLRHLGWLLVVPASILLGQGASPEILVHGYGYHIAARQQDGHLRILSIRADNYVPEKWLQYDGDNFTDKKFLKQAREICDAPVCYLPYRDKYLARVTSGEGLAEACRKADLVIAVFHMSRREKRDCGIPSFDKSVWRYNQVMQYDRNAGNSVGNNAGNSTSNKYANKSGDRNGNFVPVSSSGKRVWMY